MRRLLTLMSTVGLAMALAASAHATAYDGNASFALSTLPGLVATGSGTGTSAPGLITINWTTGGVIGPTLITLAPTAAAPLTALNIVLTAPGPCTFTGAGGPNGGLGGACGLGGTANALVGGVPFLIVPLSGLGQNTRVNFGPYGSYIDAQAWSTGMVPVTINGATVLSDNGAPFVMTGSDNRTPGGAGTVTLVAPGGLMSTLGGAFPLFVSMTLNFVPEPGTLLLLGSGIAGLAILGRNKQRVR